MPLIVIGHLFLSGMWLGVAPRTDTKKTCVQKRSDDVLKYDKECKRNTQRKWEEPMTYLMSMRILTLIMNKRFG